MLPEASCPVVDINSLSLGTWEHFCDIICIDLHIQCCHLSQGLQPLAGEPRWPAADFLWQAAWRRPHPSRPCHGHCCSILPLLRAPQNGGSASSSSTVRGCFSRLPPYSGPSGQSVLLPLQVEKLGNLAFVHSLIHSFCRLIKHLLSARCCSRDWGYKASGGGILRC